MAGPPSSRRTTCRHDGDRHHLLHRRRRPCRDDARLPAGAIQDAVAAASSGTVRAPLLLRLFKLVPPLRRIPARLIGMGVRPEPIGPDLAARP